MPSSAHPSAPPPPPPPPPIRSFAQQGTLSSRRLPRWVWGIIVVFALAAAIFAIRAVSDGIQAFQHGDTVAHGLLNDLHAQMAQQHWEAIYTGAAPNYCKDLSRETNDQLFASIDRKLGAPVSSDMQSMFYNSSSAGTQLRATFKTRFAKNATGNETVVWQKLDGKYLLYHYQIESNDLVVR